MRSMMRRNKYVAAEATICFPSLRRAEESNGLQLPIHSNLGPATDSVAPCATRAVILSRITSNVTKTTHAGVARAL